MARIIQLERFPITTPTNLPFTMSTGTYLSKDKVIVRLHTDAGVIGVGEAMAIHTFSEETQESVLGAIDRYLRPAVIGLDVSNFAILHQAMDKALCGNPFAKAAIDIAAYDATGKILGVPVYQLLGGTYRDRVEVSQSMGILPTERALARAKEIVREGFGVIKIKIGIDPDAEIETLAAIREAVGPDHRIRVDANAGYPMAQTAIKVLERMEKYDLSMIEQPLSRFDLFGMAEVCAALRTPILADESVFTALDAVNVIRCKAADFINIKTQKAGGLYEAIKIAAVSESANVPVIIGGMSESGVGTAANAHLAAAVKYLPHPSDIRTPKEFVDDILVEPLRIEGGYTYVPQGPGLGVEVDEEKLRLYRSKS